MLVTGLLFLLVCSAWCLLSEGIPSVETRSLKKGPKMADGLWDHGLAPEDIERELREVEQLSISWKAALKSRNESTVTALYDSSALLYATFKTRLATPAQILAYFATLCAKEAMSVEFESEDIRIFARNVAINSGLYTFSYKNNGTTVSIPARYTFVYLREDAGPMAGQWEIIEHHSSQDPEKAQTQADHRSLRRLDYKN